MCELHLPRIDAKKFKKNKNKLASYQEYVSTELLQLSRDYLSETQTLA